MQFVKTENCILQKKFMRAGKLKIFDEHRMFFDFPEIFTHENARPII